MVPPASVSSRSVPSSTREVLSSLVGSASASSTPSWSGERSTVRVPPPSVSSRSVPLSTRPELSRAVRSAMLVTWPPSMSCRMLLTRVALVMSSLVGSGSASSTPSWMGARSTVRVPPASVSSRSVPFRAMPVLSSLAGSMSLSPPVRAERSWLKTVPPSVMRSTVPSSSMSWIWRSSAS